MAIHNILIPFSPIMLLRPLGNKLTKSVDLANSIDSI